MMQIMKLCAFLVIYLRVFFPDKSAFDIAVKNGWRLQLSGGHVWLILLLIVDDDYDDNSHKDGDTDDVDPCWSLR